MTQPTSAGPISLSITGTPALDGLLMKGIVLAAAWLTALATTHLNVKDPQFAEWLTAMISGGLVIGATAVWGWFNSKFHQANAVSAGLNLAAAGQMITKEVAPGVEIPVPVSTASASKIVRDFSSAALAKAS